ncbi:MAG: STAS domain-containing protein [Syntrophobacteraceae bacterium]
MVKSQVRSPAPRQIVMELDGRFDKDTAPQLRRHFLKLARENGAEQIEINLSNALCTDTSCVAVMVEILNAVQKKGGKLKVSGVGENTARLITLSQLDKIFQDIIVVEKK